MSLKGVRQLKELIIRYSDFDGSSKGVRNWMRDGLIPFAEKNPLVEIKTEKKRNVHPYVQGKYANGNSKTICIKNISEEEIYNYILDLRNQIGRRVCFIQFNIVVVTISNQFIVQMNATGYKKPVLSARPSIQGEWNERMDLIELKLEIESK